MKRDPTGERNERNFFKKASTDGGDMEKMKGGR